MLFGTVIGYVRYVKEKQLTIPMVTVRTRVKKILQEIDLKEKRLLALICRESPSNGKFLLQPQRNNISGNSTSGVTFPVRLHKSVETRFPDRDPFGPVHI